MSNDGDFQTFCLAPKTLPKPKWEGKMWVEWGETILLSDFLYGRQNILGPAHKEEFNTQKYARSSRFLTVTELFNIVVNENKIR